MENIIENRIVLDEDNPNIIVDTYIHEQTFSTLCLRPCMVICPGGGYACLSKREGRPIALKFYSMGYNTFVLSYSVQMNTESIRWPKPLYDLATTILKIKKNAKQWGVDEKQISICGFSTGGHLAGMYATYWAKQAISEYFQCNSRCFKVKAVIIIYPVLDFTCAWQEKDWRFIWGGKNPVDSFNLFMFGTHTPMEEELKKKSPVYYVNRDTSPCFIIHAKDDELVCVDGSIRMANELEKQAVPFELHIIPKGNHGFALGDDTITELSSKEVCKWPIWVDNWLNNLYL